MSNLWYYLCKYCFVCKKIWVLFRKINIEIFYASFILNEDYYFRFHFFIAMQFYLPVLSSKFITKIFNKNASRELIAHRRFSSFDWRSKMKWRSATANYDAMQGKAQRLFFWQIIHAQEVHIYTYRYLLVCSNSLIFFFVSNRTLKFISHLH